MANITKGAEDAWNLMKLLPVDLKQCQDIQDDLSKISNWAFNQDLAHVVGNLMVHLTEIQGLIAEITTDVMTDGKYEEAGEKTAEMITIVMGKISTQQVYEEIYFGTPDMTMTIY